MSAMSDVSPAAILDAVVRHYGIQARVIRSQARHRCIATPRAVGMYLTRKLTDLSYPAIGAFYGGRDHTTAIASDRKVGRWLDEHGPDARPSVICDVAEIRAEIMAEAPEVRRGRLQAARAGLARQMAQIDEALSLLTALTRGRVA